MPVVSDSLVSTNTTIAASSYAAKLLNDSISTKSAIGHTHTISEITNMGSAASMDIIISSSAPPTDNSIEYDL